MHCSFLPNYVTMIRHYCRSGRPQKKTSKISRRIRMMKMQNVCLAGFASKTAYKCRADGSTCGTPPLTDTGNMNALYVLFKTFTVAAVYKDTCIKTLLATFRQEINCHFNAAEYWRK